MAEENGQVELWLIRHGETTYGARQELAGWADPPLTERGEREAAAIRPFLDGRRFDAVWSSDLGRAVTTSRLAWGEPRPDPRLRELNFGDLEGVHWPAMDPEENAAILRFRDYSAPGGESTAELRARLEAFLAELPPGRHLVFTHGGVIRELARDLGVDRFVPTGTVIGLDWHARRLLFVHEPEA